MIKQYRILTLGLVVGALGLGALLLKGFSSCAITKAEAKKMVLAELSRVGLDPKFLHGPTQSPGSCSFDFEYEGNGRKISYVAAEDPLHGPELHRWDYADHANGP